MTCLFFLSLGVALHAQAKIDFSKATVDYGDIDYGSNGTRSFSFKNTGDRDLVIEKVSSTSSSLTVKKPNGSISPGNSGKITITYDTKKKGPIRRTITVYSNADNTPVMGLKVKGCVLKKK